MSTHEKHSEEKESNGLVRALAAMDRNSNQHKKIYEDLANE